MMTKLTVKKRYHVNLFGSICFIILAFVCFYALVNIPISGLHVQTMKMLMLGIGIMFWTFGLLTFIEWYTNFEEYEVDAREVR